MIRSIVCAVTFSCLGSCHALEGPPAVPRADGAEPEVARGLVVGTPYEDPERGFRLVLPKGWIVNPSSSVAMHYLDLCLSVSNTGREDLRVGDKLRKDGADYNAETVAEQLEPGTAYLEVGRWGGPAGISALDGRQIELEGTSLAPLVTDDAAERRRDAPLTTVNLEFRKWGRSWSVTLYLREPVSERTRREALALLRSIEFQRPDDPVWAASVAWRHLPEEARVLGTWSSTPKANWGGRQTDVERTSEGFRVTFSHTAEVGGSAKRSWVFLVRPDGSAEHEPGRP